MIDAQLFLDTVLGHVTRTERDPLTGKLIVVLDSEKQTLKDIKEMLEGEQYE